MFFSINLFQPLEEQVLSQKLSQLNITASKELSIMSEDMRSLLENIPQYLTKRNQSFPTNPSTSTINYYNISIEQKY